jgi:hypothetical protein
MRVRSSSGSHLDGRQPVQNPPSHARSLSGLWTCQVQPITGNCRLRHRADGGLVCDGSAAKNWKLEEVWE